MQLTRNVSPELVRPGTAARHLLLVLGTMTDADGHGYGMTSIAVAMGYRLTSTGRLSKSARRMLERAWQPLRAKKLVTRTLCQCAHFHGWHFRLNVEKLALHQVVRDRAMTDPSYVDDGSVAQSMTDQSPFGDGSVAVGMTDPSYKNTSRTSRKNTRGNYQGAIRGPWGSRFDRDEHNDRVIDQARTRFRREGSQ